MANPEHVRWLLQGVEAWNERRKFQDFVPDLSGEDIAARLRDAQLRAEDGKPNLMGVDLSQALLSGCNFSDTYLREANLSGTNLSGARFGGSDLIFANLVQSQLRDSDLTSATLIGARLGEANLTNCTLTGTQLIYADLVGANLTGSRPWQAGMLPILPIEWSLPSISVSMNATGINDLLQNVNGLKKHYDSLDGQTPRMFYFRGESRDTWNLTPSVMRRSVTNNNSLRDAEGEMLVDLRSRRAEDFVEAGSALDQMVVAQHYGLPTRLLDVTRNPLVALFHASEDWNESRIVSGRLHVFAVPKPLVKPFNSDTVSVITNFARLRRNEQNLLLGKTKEETQDDTDPGYGAELPLGDLYALAMNRLYQFIRLEKPSFQERIDPKDLFRVIVVEPQQSLERIKAQSGAFLISAFHERFEEMSIRDWTADAPLYHHYTLTVPSSSKVAIREELATFNITRETMFPGLEEAARAVKGLYL